MGKPPDSHTYSRGDLMDKDARHAEIVALFPAGLTPKQFRTLTLKSADEDGKLDPPSLADWWATQSLLIGMYINGLIEKRGTGPQWNRGGPWYITEKGRNSTTPPPPGG